MQPSGPKMNPVEAALQQQAMGLQLKQIEAQNRLANAEATKTIAEANKIAGVELNGIPEVWDMVERYVEFVKENSYFDQKRTAQSKYWMYETINEQLKANFYQNSDIKALLQINEAKVLSNELSSFIAAKNLLDTYFGQKGK